MKKPLKIVGLEEALAKLPEDMREAARAEIVKSLSNFDPNDPPPNCKQVLSLPRGTTRCPECSLALRRHGPPFAFDGSTWVSLECERCDQPYSMEASDG